VFNRASGLAEEIGADISATTPTALVAALGSPVADMVAGPRAAARTAAPAGRRISKAA
jgi:hypothetical protein